MDIGHTRTHVVPISSGDGAGTEFLRVNNKKEVQYSELGGQALLRYFIGCLEEDRIHMMTTAEQALANDMLEKYGEVSPGPAIQPDPGHARSKEYELPDGQVFRIHYDKQVRPAENLFRKSLAPAYKDYLAEELLSTPLQEMVQRAVEGYEIGLRKRLLGNLILGGGGSMS